jgi:hypothetical protein
MQRFAGNFLPGFLVRQFLGANGSQRDLPATIGCLVCKEPLAEVVEKRLAETSSCARRMKGDRNPAVGGD